MAKQETLITKKRRGPAPTGVGQLIGVRMSPEALADLDAWIAKQKQPLSRPQAIRLLVTHALKKPGKLKLTGDFMGNG
ncbi:MAG: hypothetical protein QM698_14180 [Micropepsaceae bacterium]